jgi:hypothetical protein
MSMNRPAYQIKTDADGVRRLRLLCELSRLVQPKDHDLFNYFARKVLSDIAGDDFAQRFLAEPLPRPPIEVITHVLPEMIEFTIGLGAKS